MRAKLALSLEKRLTLHSIDLVGLHLEKARRNLRAVGLYDVSVKTPDYYHLDMDD